MLRAALLAGLVLLTISSGAYAHGKHHWSTPVKPAYDCFKYVNPETGNTVTTEGNVEITHDDDLDIYVKWRCKCVQTTSPGYYPPRFVCWWHEVDRKKTLTPDWIPDGPNRKEPRLRIKWVTWMAHPESAGCHSHKAEDAVLVIALKGNA
ncbi:MAG TPA: hypothetical protein VG845_11570 [Dehalococcoidia bacterium]|jgi:hypothetical protein|nr:hypothetical protein [Dehalococcoidia bacterium]